jgi:hypothetical protein
MHPSSPPDQIHQKYKSFPKDLKRNNLLTPLQCKRATPPCATNETQNHAKRSRKRESTESRRGDPHEEELEKRKKIVGKEVSYEKSPMRKDTDTHEENEELSVRGESLIYKQLN